MSVQTTMQLDHASPWLNGCFRVTKEIMIANSPGTASYRVLSAFGTKDFEKVHVQIDSLPAITTSK